MPMGEASLSKKEQIYIDYFNALMSEVRQANIHFQIWKALAEATNKYNAELNEARVFFASTIYAHLKSSITHACKLIDEHPDALSILKFLNFVENNLEIFSTERFTQRIRNREHVESLIERHIPVTSQMIVKDRRKLKSLESVRKRLVLWRNKREAHLDIKELSSNLIEKCPISVTKFKELILTCACILEHYSAAYNGTIHSLEVIGKEDWKNVLEAIKYRRNAEVQKSTTRQI